MSGHLQHNEMNRGAVQARLRGGDGRDLLRMLREYREDITAPLVAENARLRAELERVRRGAVVRSTP